MIARLRLWWQQIKQHWVSVGVGAIVFVVVIVIIIIGYQFDWTGFNGYNKVTITHIISGTNAGTVTRTEEYQPGKGVWDWLQLLGVLAIPAVVGFGAVWFTTRQTRISEENRKQQHDTEMQIAENQQQDELLRTYVDKLSELLLDKELNTNPNIQSIVRARTLAALHILNTERKAIVLRFLHDAGLLQYVKFFLYSLDLSNTDLRKIDLSGVNLWGANLQEADLKEVNLQEANLSRANLSGAYPILANLSKATLWETNLNKANLWGVNLNKANLRGANLQEANLSRANLQEADLSGANLQEANLQEANLDRAIVTPEQLAKAKSLQGATMPDGSKHN